MTFVTFGRSKSLKSNLPKVTSCQFFCAKQHVFYTCLAQILLHFAPIRGKLGANWRR
jgi:hypothetical protein